GGYVGEDLRHFVFEKGYKTQVSRPEVLNESYYLNQKEDFRDRLPLTPSPDLEIGLRETGGSDMVGVMLRNNGQQDLIGCVVDMMADEGAGYYAPFKTRAYGVTIKAQEKLVLNLSARQPRGIRVFVDQCRQGSPQAAEWINHSPRSFQGGKN